jgi:hypothetical protein
VVSLKKSGTSDDAMAMDMGEEQEEGQAAEEPVDEVMDMDDDDVPDLTGPSSTGMSFCAHHVR